MKNLRYYTLLLLLLLLSASAAAGYWHFDENTIVRHIGTDEGLSNMRAFSVQKDTRGFVWIATRTGVDRYDGRWMRHYTLSESQVKPDEHGQVNKLYIDPLDRLWCYTNSGKLFRYDEFSDDFVLQHDVWEIVGDKRLQVNDLQMTPDSACWVALSTGALRVKGRHAMRYQFAHGVNAFVPFQGSFLAVTDEGVFRFDESTQRFTVAIPSVHATCGYYDEVKDELWVGTLLEGLRLFARHGERWAEHSLTLALPHQPYLCMERINPQLLAVGIDGGGVAVIDVNRRSLVTCITENTDSSLALRGNGVYSLEVADRRFLWVATYTGGVTVIDSYANSFKVDMASSANRRTPYNTHINAIIEDREGDRWYATNKGIVVHLVKENKRVAFLEREGVFLSLCEDPRSGDVWVGGFGGGLMRVNKHSGVVARYKKESGVGLTSDFIFALLVHDEQLWVGGLHGNLVRLSLPLGSGLPTTYQVPYVNALTLTPSKAVAAATVNGLYVIRKDTLPVWYANTSVLNGVPFNTFIYSCYFESDSLVWLGTNGAGLCRYSLADGSATLYTTAEGLPSNYVYALLPDTQGGLWVTTDNGLIRLDMRGEALVRYGASDGLTVSDFNFNAAAILRNGELAFGTTNGVVSFHPRTVSKSVEKRELLIWDFKLSYRSVLPGAKGSPLTKPISATSSLELAYFQNTFSLSFGVIDFWGENYFRYRLRGYDETWIYADATNTANYTQVPPGSYVFEVEHLQSTPQGYAVLERKEVGVAIAKPYWARWWAWLCYGVMLSYVVYRLWKMREERIKAKFSEEKARFFVHAAHDLRTPVTLIKAPLEELTSETLTENGRSALRMAQKSSERLYQMVGQLLDFQQTDLHAMRGNFRPTAVVRFIDERLQPFAGWCRQKQIDLRVVLPSEEFTAVVDPMLLGKMIDNLMSNAVKYTPLSGTIVVEVEQKERSFLFRVTDSGIGIPRKAQHAIFTHFFRAQNAYNTQAVGSGIGLMLTRSYVQLHGGQLSFTSSEGKGSTFQFVLPTDLESTVEAVSVLPASEPEVQPYVDEEPAEVRSFHTKLLLVEDNVDLRTYLTGVLSRTFRVLPFETADAAMEHLRRETVDIILSDVMMPGTQGDVFCSWIKGNMATSHIPIILLSARSEKTDVLDGLRRGADDYLPKPFDLDILLGRIANLLESRKRMKQRYMSFFEVGAVPPKESEEENIEEQFLQKMNQLLMAHIADTEYQIEALCRDMAMSRSLLYGKLKALTGESPSEFIRSRRIRYAQALLEEGGCSVVEAAEKAGFADVKNFSTLFKKVTGVTPGKVRRKDSC